MCKRADHEAATLADRDVQPLYAAQHEDRLLNTLAGPPPAITMKALAREPNAAGNINSERSD